MKRCWFGAGLLAVFLLSGLLTSRWAKDCYGEITESVARAETAFARENWDMAERMTEGARDRWEEYWRLSASITDHSPMEQVDSLFDQLDNYTRGRDAIGCMGLCAQLRNALEAIAESHSLTWWNLM